MKFSTKSYVKTLNCTFLSAKKIQIQQTPTPSLSTTFFFLFVRFSKLLQNETHCLKAREKLGESRRTQFEGELLAVYVRT